MMGRSQFDRGYAAHSQGNIRSRFTPPVMSVESLESRQHLAATPPTAVSRAAAATLAAKYAPAKKVTLPITASIGKTGVAPAAVTFPTNSAGLPLLTSRADGQGLKIFFDFDGYTGSSWTDTPFSTDADTGTFNASEQKVIYNAWRDVVSYFSPFNVNVTTVQPPTGGANPVFAWIRVINNVPNGYGWSGGLTNSSSQAYAGSNLAVNGTGGLAHSAAHLFGLQDISDYDRDGNRVNEYSAGYLTHNPIMGDFDYASIFVRKWVYGRTSGAADSFQNDVARISASVASRVSGDGFRPDDFAAATPLPLTNGSYQTAGIIERPDDADVFQFTSTGQMFNINVEPTFESGLAAKVEVFDSSGNLVAARDATSQRAANENTGDDFTLNLPEGTYTAKVSSHGDYGDIGEYAFFASPLPAGWNTVDVNKGFTGRGGYVTYDAAAGTFYQGGSGSDISGTTDSFRFTYQVLNGTGSITARVTGLDNTDPFAKAGLMVRETLAKDSKFAMIQFRPTSGVAALYRTSVGAAATSVATTATPLTIPNWMQLSRSGNVITLQQSTDGVNFTPWGTATIPALASQVYLGLAVTSHTIKQQATATFTDVSLTGAFGTAAPTFNALAAPANLTAVPVAAQSTAMTLNWSDGAGETGYAIERSIDNVSWAQVATVAANVTTYTNDPVFGAMRWWYRVTATNGSGKSVYSDAVSVMNKPRAPTTPLAVAMSTSYLSLSWRDTSGDTGYRVERSDNSGTTFAVLGTTAANITGWNDTGLVTGTTYTYRITPLSPAGDGVPLVFTATPALTAVTGLGVTNRTATAVGLSWADINFETGYRIERSTDRSTWTAVGTTSADITAFTDVTAAPLTHYYYRVFGTTPLTESVNASNVTGVATPAAAANPSPWADAAIGSPPFQGTGAINGTTATAIGSGSTAVVAANDQFHMLYRPLTGDGQITAHVSSQEAFNELCRVGVTFRETLASNSKYASVMRYAATSQYEPEWHYRAAAGDNAVAVSSNTDQTYTWLRVVRSGSTFISSISKTGTNGSWVTVGATTIAMANTVYVGLVATSRDNGFLNKSTFDNVAVVTAPGPAVMSMSVNNGAAQRSRVSGITMTFNSPVTLAAGAVTLTRRTSAAAAATAVTGFVVTPSADNSTYTLTFPAGTAFPGGSLPDGLYDVRVAAAGVTNTDGYALASDATLSLHRLFGDADGDRGVSINDFNGFTAAFGRSSADPLYNGAFDFDGDNGISINDFNEFTSRFGVTI